MMPIDATRREESASVDPNSVIRNTNNEELYHDYDRQVRSRRMRWLSLMASPLTDDTGSFRAVLAGMTSLFLIGATIGLVTPKNLSLPNVLDQYVSASIGYTYFLAWSVSFYPQVVSNFKRQSTMGLSPDFCVLNVLGFACYAAYTASFFWSSKIQELYRQRHGPDAEITVQSNDVAFAVHALVLSSVTVLQIMHYGGGLKALKLSKPIAFIFAGILVVCATYPILIWITSAHGGGGNNKHVSLNWLDYLYLLSFVKIGISLIKYVPQVVLNSRRMSTVGWSIWNILLDFTGGGLSILQLVLDCADMKDFSGITGNPAKFGLGFVSIIFDLIFMVQHYCLYANNIDGEGAGSEHLEPLLPTEETQAQEGRHGNESEAERPATIQPQTVMV